MKNNFNDCLNRVLQDEGGYSNVPGDKGGPTNFGITLTDYRKYINPRGVAQDVKNMSVDQAKAIYRSKYWDALGCDNLASGVDYTCFDYGVNSGLGRPRKALQRFKSKTGIDLINAINDERLSFLIDLGRTQAHDQQFEKGWQARVARVRQHSIDLAKTPPQTPKAAGSIIVALAAAFSNGYHWVLAHPYESAGIAVAMGALTYAVIHFIHKVIK